MKWPKALLKPTREYTGGILCGIGVGMMLTSWILESGRTDLPWVLFLFLGSCFIAVGSTLAKAGQCATGKRVEIRTNSRDALSR